MSFLRHPPWAIALILVAGVAAATTATPDKPAASQAARTFASRDQLRECLNLEDALKARRSAIETSNAARDLEFDRVEAEKATLLEAQRQLDRSNPAAIRAFNVLVTDLKQHVDTLNQDASDAQVAGEAYNVDTVAVNHKCSPLSYRVEDREAVTRERKKAAAAAAASSASSR